MKKRMTDQEFKAAILGNRSPPNSLRAYGQGVRDGEANIETLRQEVSRLAQERNALIGDKNRLERILEVGFPAQIEFEELPGDLGGWLKTDRITLAAVHDILANSERPHARFGSHQVVSRHRVAYINIMPRSAGNSS